MTHVLHLVLEYMKRGDLLNVLKQQSGGAEVGGGSGGGGGITPLPDFELWNIFRQVVSGVRYLHFQNIIHGDIKPQNLLVSEEGVVKIADFGISKMLKASGQKLADAAGITYNIYYIHYTNIIYSLYTYKHIYIYIYIYKYTYLCTHIHT